MRYVAFLLIAAVCFIGPPVACIFLSPAERKSEPAVLRESVVIDGETVAAGRTVEATRRSDNAADIKVIQGRDPADLTIDRPPRILRARVPARCLEDSFPNEQAEFGNLNADVVLDGKTIKAGTFCVFVRHGDMADIETILGSTERHRPKDRAWKVPMSALNPR